MKLLARAIAVVLGFLRENAPESATRLVMLVCTFTGVGIAASVIVFAFKNKADVQMACVLAGMLVPFIVHGAIAVAQRTTKKGEPGDSGTPVPPEPQ